MAFLVDGALIFLIALWLVLIVSMLLILWGGLTTRVPYVPLPHGAVRELVRALSLNPGDRFYDLGSGDGRVVRAVAEAFPGTEATGVEKAPFPFLASRFRLRRRKIKNAQIVSGDFFDAPLFRATHIYMYLLPKTVQALLPKFERELAPGTIVVSCDFPFTARAAERTMNVRGGRYSYTLYFYTF